MTPPLRWLVSGLLAFGLTAGISRLGLWWLGATLFTSEAYYDACAALLTLALPAFCAGLAIGLVARRDALTASACAFALFCVAGFVHPFWSVPPVSPHSAHSGGMHYFLHSPLVALAFGTLGAWLAGQFASGQWALADREPVQPPG